MTYSLKDNCLKLIIVCVWGEKSLGSYEDDMFGLQAVAAARSDTFQICNTVFDLARFSLGLTHRFTPPACVGYCVCVWFDFFQKLIFPQNVPDHLLLGCGVEGGECESNKLQLFSLACLTACDDDICH